MKKFSAVRMSPLSLWSGGTWSRSRLTKHQMTDTEMLNLHCRSEKFWSPANTSALRVWSTFYWCQTVYFTRSYKFMAWLAFLLTDLFQESIEDLVETLFLLSSDGTQILLAFEERDSEVKLEVMKMFFEKMKTHFTWKKIPHSEHHQDFQSPDIQIFNFSLSKVK